MTLKELGIQYREEEMRIRRKIDTLRELQKSLSAPDRDLEARISDLYITALNLKSTGNYLMHYYDKEETADESLESEKAEKTPSAENAEEKEIFRDKASDTATKKAGEDEEKDLKDISCEKIWVSDEKKIGA